MNPGAFLDRDGTINVDPGYVARPEQLEFASGAIEAISKLNARGYLVAVITNQAGVARGFHTESDVDAFHAEMSRQLAQAGARVDRFYHCPHHVDGVIQQYSITCVCRKPGDLLYRRAIADLDLDPTRCIAVGDKTTDLIPARELGAEGVLIVQESHVEQPAPEEESFQRAENLRSAVERLLG